MFLLAAGWRWTIFEYKKTEPIRVWLSRYKLGEELLHCPFCQFCQSGLISALALAAAGAGSHPLLAFLQVLATGFWGCAAYPFLDTAIERMEAKIGLFPESPLGGAPPAKEPFAPSHIEELIKEFHSASLTGSSK